MAGLFTITNPLSLKKGSVTIGAAPGKGQSNTGSLLRNTPAVTYRNAGASGSWTTKSSPSKKPSPSTSRNTNSSSVRTVSSSSRRSAPVKSAAQIAAEQALARAKADYAALKTNTYGSITDLIGDNSNKYKSSLLDWQDDYKQKRGDITNAAVKNELAKVQGTRDVLDMVGTGVRSGGVILNNSNAANSSGAEGIANAYGQLGRKQMSQVGNDYEMGNEDIKTAEDQLALAAAQQARHAGENKDSTVNSIVSMAADKLGALNQSAASASLPDRINVEAEKAKIRSQALAALQQYDYILSQTTQQNAPTSKQDNFSKALSQANAGMAPETAFQYNSSVPTQLQGTGPFASSLPLFTYGR